MVSQSSKFPQGFIRIKMIPETMFLSIRPGHYQIQTRRKFGNLSDTEFFHSLAGHFVRAPAGTDVMLLLDVLFH